MPYPPCFTLLLLVVFAAAGFAPAAEAAEADVRRMHACGSSFERTIERVPPSTAWTRPVHRPVHRPARKRWRFAVAPYGWLAGVDGTAYSDGVATDFEVTFEDILERTNGGFQLYAEARYDRFYVAFDGTWATLGDVIERRFLGVDVEIEQTILDLRLGYRVLRHVLCRGPAQGGAKPQRTLDVYLYAGVRYFETTTKVDVTLPIVGTVPLDDTSTTTDALLGARVTLDLGRRWSLSLQGDAAAFFESDNMSWQTHVSVGYHVNHWLSVLAGYRWMGMDQTTGSGASKNGAEMVNHGPLIGVGFTF